MLYLAMRSINTRTGERSHSEQDYLSRQVHAEATGEVSGRPKHDLLPLIVGKAFHDVL